MKTNTLLKTAKTTRRAALYLRFSTGEQGQNAYTTIDAQRQYLTAWAAQNNYEIVDEFSDEAKTGTSLGRPGYRALKAAARLHAFDVVIVTYMDRLGRGEAFTIAKFELESAGVQIVTALQTFTKDTGGYISQTARQMVDGIYPRLVAEWTASKMVAMLAQGYHCAGRAPFGYAAVPVEIAHVEEGKHPPKRLVPHPDTAEIVRECYRRVADGETKSDIRRYLYDVTDEWWSYDKVTRLLTSHVYQGIAKWGEHINEAAHLPLIDATLWEEAQTALAAEKPERHRRAPNAHHYYLGGRVRCACGRSMTTYWSRGRAGKLYRYYQCLGTRTAQCRVQISTDILHNTVFVEVAALARSPWRVGEMLEKARQILPDGAQAKQDATRYRREAHRLERERERFLAALKVAPTSAIKTLSAQLGELENKIEANQNAVGRAESAAEKTAAIPTVEECQTVLARIGELWGEATEDERVLLAGLLVEGVVVHGGSKPCAETRYNFANVSTVELGNLRGGVRLNAQEKGE